MGLLPVLSLYFILGQASLMGVEYWTNRIKEKSFAPTEAAGFCSEMQLLCNNNAPIVINDQNHYDPPYILDHANIMRFFPDSDLVKGASLLMHNPRERMYPSRPYLPYSLSKEVKIDMQSLPELHKMFGVSKGTNMSTNLKNAATACSAPRHTCVFSEQAMKELVSSEVGSDSVKLLQTGHQPDLGPLFMATVSRVEKMTRSGDGGDEEPSLICHEAMFPFRLYSCRSVQKTQIFTVGFDIDNIKGKTVYADLVAACHTDTSSWSKKFPAFKELGMQPGKGTVCHWIGGDDMVWVKA